MTNLPRIRTRHPQIRRPKPYDLGYQVRYQIWRSPSYKTSLETKLIKFLKFLKCRIFGCAQLFRLFSMIFIISNPKECSQIEKPISQRLVLKLHLIAKPCNQNCKQGFHVNKKYLMNLPHYFDVIYNFYQCFFHF